MPFSPSSLPGISAERTLLYGRDLATAVSQLEAERSRYFSCALDRLIEYNEADTRNLGPLADLIYCQLIVERHHPHTPRPPFA